jgi:hypothetical protein
MSPAKSNVSSNTVAAHASAGLIFGSRSVALKHLFPEAVST